MLVSLEAELAEKHNAAVGSMGLGHFITAETTIKTLNFLAEGVEYLVARGTNSG